MSKSTKNILKELKRPNIVFLITDQQTWNPNYAEGFKGTKLKKKSFPAMDKLLAHSVAFQNAHCNSCTCSPSRATLFTGNYPAQHGVNQVLAFDDPFNTTTNSDKEPAPKGDTQVMQGMLRNNFQNMFRMMESADYQVAYKGKWHITKPTQFVTNKPKPKDMLFDELYWTEQDVPYLADMYGVKEWNYPDAGDDGNVYNFGGGRVNNDSRFVDGNGHSAWYKDEIPLEDKIKASAVEYIKNVDTNKGKDPFFLVVSLVNPHDVLSYPGDGPAVPEQVRPLYKKAGYKDRQFKNIDVKLPSTWDEKLFTKPKIQSSWRALCQETGAIKKGDKKKARKYVQFYAHLSSVVDQEINKVLTAMEDEGHMGNTLFVRISDHGDMAMSHGRQRQKMYNVYEQTINIPMIFSHPKFKTSKTTDSFAGLIDLMPTLAEIAGVDESNYTFQGTSLVDILEDPSVEVQNHIHFTYDDNYLTTNKPWDMGACHIRCIKKKDADGTVWKYAVYFDPDYGQKMEYEMYNLTRDPEEKTNLAFSSKDRSGPIWKQRQRLHRFLTKVMHKKGTMPDGVLWPTTSGGEK